MQATCNNHPDYWKSASELRLQLLSKHPDLTIELAKNLHVFCSKLSTVETPLLELRPSTSTLTQYSTPCSKAQKQEISSSSLGSTIKPYARRYLRSKRKRKSIPGLTKQPKAAKAKDWNPSLFEYSKEDMTRTTAIFHRSHRCLVRIHLYLF
jgi:hypothetical protein